MRPSDGNISAARPTQLICKRSSTMLISPQPRSIYEALVSQVVHSEDAAHSGLTSPAQVVPVGFFRPNPCGDGTSLLSFFPAGGLHASSQIMKEWDANTPMLLRSQRD